MAFSKGEGAFPAQYATGGATIQKTDSKFLKAPEAFRSQGDPDRTYKGKSPKGKDKAKAKQ